MASFTDELVGFNPYIPQIPVDDYVRVGMIKQQQYNEGVQKVQTYIDSVAGMDVVKPEQKEYLQQRVGQLQGEVSKIVSQDFSNQQLVNSVGNLTNKIAGDPIVQNAVLSTQRYRAGLADMKEANDKGLNSPSNEFVFNQSVQKWLGDKDVKSTFNGQYEKYTDTKKPILEAINALKPGANITDIPYETDAAGNYVLDQNGDRKIAYATLREKLEGVSEGRVKQAIEASVTPQMKRQFQIDGMYNYRGLDKSGLKKMTDDSYNNRLGKVNDILEGLTTQLNTAQNSDADKDRIQRQITAYQGAAKDLQSKYTDDVHFLDQNPDAYKGELHYQDEIAKYTLGYSWSKHSLTYENNPLFNGVMKEKAQNLNYDKFREMTNYHQNLLGLKGQELGLKMRDLDIKEEGLRLKYGTGPGGKGGGQFGLDLPTLGPIDQATLESIDISTLTKQVDNMSQDLDQQKMKMIGQLPGGDAWLTNRDGQLIYKDAKSKDSAETAIATMKGAYDKDPASVSPAAQTYFSTYNNTDGIIKNFKATADNIMKEADAAYPLSSLTKGVSPLSFQSSSGNNYSYTPAELLDLGTRYNRAMDDFREGEFGDVESPNDARDKTLSRFGDGKEKALISIYMKQGRILGPGHHAGNSEEDRIQNTFYQVLGKLDSPEARNASSQRDEFISLQARRAYTQQQQQNNPIVSYKSADRERAKANFVQIINDQKAAGKSNSNPLFDESDIRAMLDNKNFPNTSYSLHTKADGTHAVRFSNTTLTDKPREIDITPEQAGIWFGNFVNEFKPLQQAIDLSKYNGTAATTDVRRLGKESAYNVPATQQLQNYSVKYHVEEPYPGQYQVKLYVYDKKGKQWLPDRYLDIGGRMLSPEQVTRAVSNLTDSEIQRELKLPTTGNSNSALYPRQQPTEINYRNYSRQERAAGSTQSGPANEEEEENPVDTQDNNKDEEQ